MEDLVSVIIPTYKRSETLSRAIESVLRQNYKKIELIVVDDNEKDTPDNKYVIELIKKYKNKLIYINPEEHKNGAVARNIGINVANGKYIAFLDDDDEWEENKLLEQMMYLKTTSTDGVSCLYRVIKNKKIIRECYPYTSEKLHRKVIGRETAVLTSTLLLKKEILLKFGAFDERLQRHQDLQLLLDYLYQNKIGVLNKVLVNIYADSEINHPNVEKMIEVKNTFFNICKKHFEIYGKSERKDILSSHYFEIVLLAMREKKIKLAISYLFKIGFNLKAYYSLYLRWKKRKHNRNT